MPKYAERSNMKATWNQSQIHTMINSLRVAAEKFKEDAEMFKSIVDSGEDQPMITVDAARNMRDQFVYQAQEARKTMLQLQHAEEISFEMEACEDCGGNKSKEVPCVC